jgi:hypothetical protein
MLGALVGMKPMTKPKPKTKQPKQEQPTQALTTQQAFFFEHAGWSYDPKTETSIEGRTRCAIELAAAETWAAENGVEFEERPDADDCADGDIEPSEIKERIGIIAWLPDEDGEVRKTSERAGLWGIVNADGNYKRVVRAELADELRPEEEEAKQFRTEDLS